MQVANDVARTSSQVAKPAQAGARKAAGRRAPRGLRRGRWSVVSLAESAAFVAYEASSLGPWSAVMLASRLESCAATKAALAILVPTSSGVSSPSTVESREARTLASALPARAASRAAVVTAPRRAAAILESTSEEVSADSRA